MLGLAAPNSSICCGSSSSSSFVFSALPSLDTPKGTVLLGSVRLASLQSNLKPIKVISMAANVPVSELESSSTSLTTKQALISLSDKRELAFLGNGLINLGYKIVSTGGTAAALENAGISVTNVEEVTHFPEMLDGRVKTLHPNVHGGILARRDLKHHMEALSGHGISTFDVVVVHLYPFYDKVSSPEGVEFQEGIENIDIGGHTLIRAAAKNHKDVLVVVDPQDYPALLEFLKGTLDDPRFSRYLASKAFDHTTAYDSAISQWFRKENGGGTHFQN